MNHLNNSKIILICNRTKRKLPKKSKKTFRVGNGNFENSKLFEGSGIGIIMWCVCVEMVVRV